MKLRATGQDEGKRFQEFLWRLLDDTNRRRLTEFDEDPWAKMDVSDKLHLAAAAYHITFLCDELEDPRAGFEALLDQLRRDETLPPKIAFLDGCPGASIAVACLSSYDGYGSAASIESRRRVAELLIQRLV